MLKKDRNRKIIFVIFGPQGSGKSTQVELLRAKYQLTVFEAGDQLRRKAAVDEELHQTIKKGQLVANDQMLKLVNEFIDTHPADNGYIFDGYPRNIEQSQGFLRLAHANNWHVVVIYMHISDTTAKKRLSQRFEIINGEKFIREDDQPEVVNKRLSIFKSVTLPIKSFLSKYFTVLEVDGEPDEATVWADVQNKLERKLYD